MCADRAIALVVGLLVALSGCTNSDGTTTDDGAEAEADATEAEGLSQLTTSLAEEPEEGVALHLRVSNQSFDQPNVALNLYVDGELVVTGTFPVETQHTEYAYDLMVDSGAHELRAEAPNVGVELTETIEMAAESWGYISYWDEAEGPHFTWNLSDQELARE